MPQVIFLALLGAGAYAGIRALMRASEQFAADLKRGQEAVRAQAPDPPKARDARDATLELDPASGIYKPVKRQD